MACPRAWQALCARWDRSWGAFCGVFAQGCLDPSQAHSCYLSSSSALSLAVLLSSITSCHQSHTRRHVKLAQLNDTCCHSFGRLTCRVACCQRPANIYYSSDP